MSREPLDEVGDEIRDEAREREGETGGETPSAPDVHAAIEAIYRRDSRRVFATLVRLLGDLERAEEALHDAFRAALESWPEKGMPGNPRSWLISAGRFRAIDRMRRDSRYTELAEGDAGTVPPEAEDAAPWGDAVWSDEEMGDDRLRLIFTCCHPALAPDAQVALTLREMCGLTTEEIASAFLVPAPTLAQRIVRAKAKIRDARIPYRVPERSDLAERLGAVLRVVYLVFNEGYAATSGDTLVRADLSAEALRLGRLLGRLLPEPEVLGLLALMLLHDARRKARTSPTGDVVLLEDQDRSLWDRAQIAEGIALTERALTVRSAGEPPGPYALQAAIAAVHSEAATAAQTDWPQIVALYDVLLRLEPSPVVELNHAVAVAMRDGAAAGLARVEAILGRGDLDDYPPAHAVLADLHRRLGHRAEAREAYRRALALTRQEPVRRFLLRRLDELGGG